MLILFLVFWRLLTRLTVCPVTMEMNWLGSNSAIRPLSCHRVLETGLQPANAPSTPASRRKMLHRAAAAAFAALLSRENRRGAHWNPLYCDNCTLIGTGLEMTRPAYRHNRECPAVFGSHFRRKTKLGKMVEFHVVSMKKFVKPKVSLQSGMERDPKLGGLAYID